MDILTPPYQGKHLLYEQPSSSATPGELCEIEPKLQRAQGNVFQRHYHILLPHRQNIEVHRLKPLEFANVEGNRTRKRHSFFTNHCHPLLIKSTQLLPIYLMNADGI